MEKIIFRNSTNVKYQQLKNVLEKDKLRPQFSGVFFDVENKKIVGTNGRILFAYDIEIIEKENHFNSIFQESLKDIVIDARIFNQNNWLNVPKEDLELVEFHVSEEKTEVYLNEEIVAISNNIPHNNKYPNWKAVLGITAIGSKMSVDSRLMKQAFSALPNGFETPEINFGNKILIKSVGYDLEEKEVSIVGLMMPLNFQEANILNESEVVFLKGEFRENLIGREVSKHIIKTWNEDFVDEDTNEVVPIERNEIIIARETILDSEIIELLVESGIKSVSVLK